jgi:hypothetical protein
MNIMKTMGIVVLALMAVAISGCSKELTSGSSPVLLVVTNTQNLNKIDLAPNNDPDCGQNVGTISMQLLPRSSNVTGPFVQARITRYRVSYRRTDGGTLIPAPFVRSMDLLIGLNQTSGLNQFLIMEAAALSQAPFAALLPQNGGRDPETGMPVVKMDVIVELFGETLGGDRVYDATAFPLDFCYNCGGCD